VPLLVRCRRLEIAGLQEQLKVILAARIGSQGFGARCEKLGRLPEEIYAELTRDCLCWNKKCTGEYY
jgi:hypothetical protein